MTAHSEDFERQTLSIEAAGKMLGIGRSVAYELAQRSAPDSGDPHWSPDGGEQEGAG